jgi:hypothetical protein
MEVVPNISVIDKRLQETFTLTRLADTSEKLPINYGEE